MLVFLINLIFGGNIPIITFSITFYCLCASCRETSEREWFYISADFILLFWTLRYILIITCAKFQIIFNFEIGLLDLFVISQAVKSCVYFERFI